MNLYAAIIGTSIAAVSWSATYAAPNDSYCRNLGGALEADTLYVATCDKIGCLRKVEKEGDGAVLRGPGGQQKALDLRKSYRFLYATNADDIQNSMVVVQLKHIGATPGARKAEVQLARDALKFACVGFFKRNVYRGSWPGDVNNEDGLPGVSYDQYDQYHRSGYTTPDQSRILHDDFHTSYFDGQTCVSTLEPVRRQQFLLFGRRTAPDRFASFFSRLGAAPGSAEAEEPVLKYERFKILLTNYQKEPQKSGCVSFNVRSNSPELEVSLSDLEDKARHWSILSRSQLKTWNFHLK